MLDYWLAWPCADNHSCYVFMSAVVLSYLKDTFCFSSSILLLFTTFQPLLRLWYFLSIQENFSNSCWYHFLPPKSQLQLLCHIYSIIFSWSCPLYTSFSHIIVCCIHLQRKDTHIHTHTCIHTCAHTYMHLNLNLDFTCERKYKILFF